MITFRLKDQSCKYFSMIYVSVLHKVMRIMCLCWFDTADNGRWLLWQRKARLQ